MDWEIELITLYLFVCKQYVMNLSAYCARMAHHTDLKFSDEEAITLYLYGVIEGCRTIKAIHRYAQKHLSNWFPHLPGYKAFDYRINQLSDTFEPLVELICNKLLDRQNLKPLSGLIDSMPIIMAQRGRRFHAKVAPEIATRNGYCATKKLHYYGVKLHAIGSRQKGSLPIPVCLGLTDAGMHDRKAFEQILPFLPHNMLDCYADKAYQVEAEPVHQENHITLFTPVKKEKGQTFLDAADQWLSTAIAQVRQPIESFFNWINEKTGVQIASKVRSYQGLLVHVFGKLAAALTWSSNLRHTS
ncbi:TPA: transposase [Legionella pneumophila]|nr:transposase [Legionella pneumophila]